MSIQVRNIHKSFGSFTAQSYWQQRVAVSLRSAARGFC